MKINIQKAIKCLTCFVVVAVLVLGNLPSPAHAAGVIYDPADYVSSVVTNGDIKTVTYSFDGITPLTRIIIDDLTDYEYGDYEFNFGGNVETFQLTTFITGQRPFVDLSNYGGVIDVSDIMPNAPLELTASYHLQAMSIDTLDSVNVKWRWGIASYDENLQFIEMLWTPYETKDLVGSGTLGISLDPTTVFTITADTHYIMPSVEVYWSSSTLNGVTFRQTFKTFSMSCDVNMVYENSLTMQAINNKLDDIGGKIDIATGKLDDIKDKVQSSLDKMDLIITGGSAGEALGDASDTLDDSNNELSDKLDEYDNVSSRLPSTPSDMNEVVDQNAINDAVDEAEKIFDWDASGLNYMFVPMTVSLGLAVLFYVVFGKGG